MSYTSPVVVRPGNPGLYSPTIEHARGMAAMAVVLYHAYVWLLAPDAVSVFNTGFAPWWYSIVRILKKIFEGYDLNVSNEVFVIISYIVAIFGSYLAARLIERPFLVWQDRYFPGRAIYSDVFSQKTV